MSLPFLHRQPSYFHFISGLSFWCIFTSSITERQVCLLSDQPIYTPTYRQPRFQNQHDCEHEIRQCFSRSQKGRGCSVVGVPLESNKAFYVTVMTLGPSSQFGKTPTHAQRHCWRLSVAAPLCAKSGLVGGTCPPGSLRAVEQECQAL